MVHSMHSEYRTLDRSALFDVSNVQGYDLPMLLGWSVLVLIAIGLAFRNRQRIRRFFSNSKQDQT